MLCTLARNYSREPRYWRNSFRHSSSMCGVQCRLLGNFRHGTVRHALTRPHMFHRFATTVGVPSPEEHHESYQFTQPNCKNIPIATHGTCLLLACARLSRHPHAVAEGRALGAPAPWCTRRLMMMGSPRCSRVSRLSCLGRRRRWPKRFSKQESWVSLTNGENSVHNRDSSQGRGRPGRTGENGSGVRKTKGSTRRIRLKSPVLRPQVPDICYDSDCRNTCWAKIHTSTCVSAAAEA